MGIADDLSKKAMDVDPANEIVLRVGGVVAAKKGQNSSSPEALQKAIELMAEAKEISPSSANTRNFFLAKKMLWLSNQEAQAYMRAKIEKVLADNGVDLAEVRPYLRTNDRATVEHIPKDFICPLTMVG